MKNHVFNHIDDFQTDRHYGLIHVILFLNMIRPIIACFLIGGFGQFTLAQSVFKRPFEPKQAILIDLNVRYQIPGGDMAERFGTNAAMGLDLSYKSSGNWLFTAGAAFIFGKNLKEKGILDSLKGSTGELIDQNGQFSMIGMDQRGYYFGGSLSKILPLKSANRNSGFVISAGAGYLSHHIRIYSTKTVPQLTDEYKKGYDRLTGGFSTTQFVGYRFLDPRKRLNFTVGMEFIQGYTQNQRSYNFDTRQAETASRLDLLYGLKFGLSIPLYLKKAEEEEFFE